VGDKGVDGASLGKNVVDAPRPIAEKLSLSPGLAIQQWTKRVAHFLENRIRKHIAKDDVAVGAEFFQRLTIRHGSLFAAANPFTQLERNRRRPLD
jgi:hypothetical protein